MHSTGRDKIRLYEIGAIMELTKKEIEKGLSLMNKDGAVLSVKDEKELGIPYGRIV